MRNPWTKPDDLEFSIIHIEDDSDPAQWDAETVYGADIEEALVRYVEDSDRHFCRYPKQADASEGWDLFLWREGEHKIKPGTTIKGLKADGWKSHRAAIVMVGMAEVEDDD